MTLISNDTLRSAISLLYGYDYRTYKTFENEFLVEHHNIYIKPLWINKFSTFERSYPKGFDSFHAKPIDYDGLMSNTRFLQIINDSMGMYTTFSRMQNSLQEKEQLLVNRIDIEIAYLKH